MSHRERVWTTTSRAACALLFGLLAGCTGAGGAAKDEPGCPVARVGGDVVTLRDADIVRAVIQPPLTRDEAKRLAIAATAAYRRQHAQEPMAGMGARLAAYRQSVRDDSGQDGPPVEPGACWDARPPATSLAAR